MAGSVTIQGLLTATTSGTQYIGPFTIEGNTPGNFEINASTPIGTSAFGINLPTWCVMFIVIPPATNAIALNSLGASSSNSAFGLSPSLPTFFSLPDPPPATMWFTAGGAYADPIFFVFA